jgi:hypothetical protein
MDQFNKVDLSILIQQTIKSKTIKSKTRKKCNDCNKKRKILDESHQICHVCYESKLLSKPSGNKFIDDFIKYTQTRYVRKEGRMEFVPHDQFKDVEFIAEGGFSKIYKAIWINCSIADRGKYHKRNNNVTVVLKQLNNSKNITSKELNEVIEHVISYFYFNCLIDYMIKNKLFLILA